MTQASNAVEAVAFASAVTEHTHDLRVLLAGLLEFELALGLLVLILAAPPVLAALALILRHDLRWPQCLNHKVPPPRPAGGHACLERFVACARARSAVVYIERPRKAGGLVGAPLGAMH